MEITATCLWFLGCTTDYGRSTLVMYICFESLSSFFIRCRALVVFFLTLDDVVQCKLVRVVLAIGLHDL